MNADAVMNELMIALQFLRQFPSHRGFGTSKLNASNVSYLAASGGDSKGVHHVSGVIMDSGSAECVPRKQLSRQGQTYHTADGGAIKNTGERTVTVSRVCDQGNNVLFTQTGGWIINHATRRCTWFPQEHGMYVFHSWINESPNAKRERWPDEPFFRVGMPGFNDSGGHVEPAVSVRPCSKTHEIQTEVHLESSNSLDVCPVVEDEMDEEIMDDKEEQSEESRAVRVGQKKTVTPTLAEREVHERTHIPYRRWCRHCVAARASNPTHRGRNFTKAIEDDKDMKLVSYDNCFM